MGAVDIEMLDCEDVNGFGAFACVSTFADCDASPVS